MKLTREEAIAEFRKMWNWIADETEKQQERVFKHEYFVQNNIPRVTCDCWLCEYGDLLFMSMPSGGGMCGVCPINFDEDDDGDICSCQKAKNSPYRKWLDTREVSEMAKYARQIANLPEKEA